MRSNKRSLIKQTSQQTSEGAGPGQHQSPHLPETFRDPLRRRCKVSVKFESTLETAALTTNISFSSATPGWLPSTQPCRIDRHHTLRRRIAGRGGAETICCCCCCFYLNASFGSADNKQKATPKTKTSKSDGGLSAAAAARFPERLHLAVISAQLALMSCK